MTTTITMPREQHSTSYVRICIRYLVHLPQMCSVFQFLFLRVKGYGHKILIHGLFRKRTWSTWLNWYSISKAVAYHINDLYLGCKRAISSRLQSYHLAFITNSKSFCYSPLLQDLLSSWGWNLAIQQYVYRYMGIIM